MTTQAPTATPTKKPPTPKPVAPVEKLFWSREETAAALDLGETTLLELVAKQDAPPPRRISPGRSGWLADEVKAWARSRPVSDLLPPKNTHFGRRGNPENV